MKKLKSNNEKLIRTIIVLSVFSFALIVTSIIKEINTLNNNEAKEFLPGENYHFINTNLVDIKFEDINKLFRSKIELMTEEDSLLSLSVNKIVFIGYDESVPDDRYYLIEGAYKCKDETNTCLFNDSEYSDSEENYPLRKYIVLSQDIDDSIYISEILNEIDSNNESFISINEEVK